MHWFNLNRQFVVFSSCCLFIAGVGLWDTYLVVEYANSIFELEENPICLYLIQQDPSQLQVFVTAKVIGITVVVTALVALYRYWKRAGVIITYAVTVFQFSLLSYLYVLSDIPHMIRLYNKWVA